MTGHYWVVTDGHDLGDVVFGMPSSKASGFEVEDAVSDPEQHGFRVPVVSGDSNSGKRSRELNQTPSPGSGFASDSESQSTFSQLRVFNLQSCGLSRPNGFEGHVLNMVDRISGPVLPVELKPRLAAVVEAHLPIGQPWRKIRRSQCRSRESRRRRVRRSRRYERWLRPRSFPREAGSAHDSRREAPWPFPRRSSHAAAADRPLETACCSVRRPLTCSAWTQRWTAGRLLVGAAAWAAPASNRSGSAPATLGRTPAAVPLMMASHRLARRRRRSGEHCPARRRSRHHRGRQSRSASPLCRAARCSESADRGAEKIGGRRSGFG